LTFEFFPLRFHLVAREAIRFPQGIPGNRLRGVFGATLKRIASAEYYARVFEPKSEAGPSGLADPPRAFVFRARHLDGRTIASGEEFHFDVNVFDVRGDTVSCFIRVFSELAQAHLLRVDREAEPKRLDLDLPAAPVSKLRVDFLTPTELKSSDRIAERPEFPILFARIRDRLSTLSAVYGDGPLAIDFAGMGERATRVVLTQCEIRTAPVERRSGRTGQMHPVGGFMGSAEYVGELAEFLPFLDAAHWTGVGRQTVWGKGEIAVIRR
jgi:CRISPR-associated endoribonuclease Cas6